MPHHTNRGPTLSHPAADRRPRRSNPLEPNRSIGSAHLAKTPHPTAESSLPLAKHPHPTAESCLPPWRTLPLPHALIAPSRPGRTLPHPPADRPSAHATGAASRQANARADPTSGRSRKSCPHHRGYAVLLPRGPAITSAIDAPPGATASTGTSHRPPWAEPWARRPFIPGGELAKGCPSPVRQVGQNVPGSALEPETWKRPVLDLRRTGDASPAPSWDRQRPIPPLREQTRHAAPPRPPVGRTPQRLSRAPPVAEPGQEPLLRAGGPAGEAGRGVPNERAAALATYPGQGGKPARGTNPDRTAALPSYPAPVRTHG
jgi:hypothetical protein